MTWTAIAPYTDPALEHLAFWVAERLNIAQPGMVRRWIVSPLPSYRVEEYPLLQLHCLSAEGEALERCKGSIRYILLNEQIHTGREQQIGDRYVMRAIAKALREYQYAPDHTTTTGAGHEVTYGSRPLEIAPHSFKADLRSGNLSLPGGATAAQLTWVEIFFEYTDNADIGRIE